MSFNKKLFKIIIFLLGWSFYLTGFIAILLMPMDYIGIINFESNAQLNLSFYIIITITSLFCFLIGFILTMPYRNLMEQKKLKSLESNPNKII